MSFARFTWTKRTIAFLLSAAFALLACVATSSSAWADDLDDRMAAAKKKQTESNQQLEALEHDLSETDQQLADAYIKLQQVQAQLPVAEAALSIATKEYQTAQREADALAQKLTDAQTEKGALETQLKENQDSMDQARSGVAEMARQAARGDMEMTSVGLIVGADSTEDFVQRYNMNTTALRSQSKSLDKLRQTRAISRNAEVRLNAVNDVIAALKDEADAKVVVAQAKEKEAEQAKAEVQNLISQQTTATQTIESRKATVEQQIKEEDATSASVANEIRQIAGLQEDQRKEEERLEKERQERERKAKEAADKAAKDKGSSNSGGSSSGGSSSGGSNSGGSTSGGSNSGSGSSSSGQWFSAWPTQYRVVTSSYGWRLHPILNYYRLHAGADLRAYCGSEIYAARSGTVKWATFKAGLGNSVLINHGTIGGKNVMSSYNHLTRYVVSNGSRVKAGQLIGYAGNTGTSAACHLHFEVYVNGSTVNPVPRLP